jgi:oligoendopeptidase F
MKQKENKTYKTEWNFKLFYQSDTDSQIEKDIEVAEKAATAFEKRWKKNTKITTDLKELKKSLVEYEVLIGMKEFSKPHLFFYLRQDSNSNNKKATSELSRIQSRLTIAQNKILFYGLVLGKISKDIQKQILKDVSFKKYYYFLELVWKSAKYDLSEAEEKILNLMYEPASGMWSRGFDKVLSNQKVEFKDKMIPIAEAIALVAELETEDRILLQKNINNVLISVSDFAESEINAVYTKKKIEDELRGYKNPYDAALLRYQNDEKTIMNLVNSVTNNFKIAHRFYALKAKILGLKKLDYAARTVSIGKIEKEFSFDKGCEILLSSFEKVDIKYKDMFESYLKNGQVDAFPRVGKTGGAYCCGSLGVPTFVLHNYTDSYKSVNTFAHEMGHAFHTELSKTQDPIYEDYTTSVAETASTLFENFAFDELFETLNDDEKIIALHDKINSSISTIFRQIACFNFEKDLHVLVRAKGFASKEEIAELMNKHMKSYLGPAFNLTPEDGYYFVNWSHIRRFFYVYSYAYGELISTALYAEYKKDKKFMTKIEQFLSAGGSKSPYQIFKDIGVDTTKPDFFLNGLKKIEEEIIVLEKLVSKKVKK